ncbi:MAG: radical SAM protein [Bacteroidales bacterium]|nr:radical SAM protein [Bacteroidales bacterium]
MKMLREETVFGPIRSRRLGNSLGINLLPVNGKLCNFDCIYCECGWNDEGRNDRKLPSAAEVESALDAALKKCREEGTRIDSVTFSGDGEPTLNPEFPLIVDRVLALRDKWCPEAKVSVLSNATTAFRPEVLAALRKVDNPIMKLDSHSDILAARINRPSASFSIEKVIASLEAFEGDFILQTMFLKGPDFDSSDREQLDGWMDVVRRLRPRQIMVYTIDRPTPMEGLLKFTEEQMRAMVRPLLDEGFNVQIKG